jgi:4-aminobutyrate aminotransferase/(S)-3-amino-2-methylpropionate transaminase
VNEAIHTPIPGPRSRAMAAALAARETRGVTYVADDFPVFWRSGSGALVEDVDGNRYIDLTSAFGVALTGHGNAAVARAIAAQAERLAHGMGDVHPSDVKVALLERLAQLAPVDDARVFLCSGGAESVEFALKTARLATGRPGVLAFDGAYHGLSYGTLEIGGIAKFREPWSDQLRGFGRFAAFPHAERLDRTAVTLDAVDRLLREAGDVGAVVVEPIQGRAGVVIPPDGFLPGLRALCDAHGALLVLDEIYTGFGRTGTMFACEREAVRPDVLCVGKALGGGFPISATIVARRYADAWAPSQGEALHTSTYLGNPMGCAAALANVAEIERRNLVERAWNGEAMMASLLAHFTTVPGVVNVRGRGMLWGIEFASGAPAGACVLGALQRGVIALQSGPQGETITLAPPLVIDDAQLARAIDLLEDAARAERSTAH